MAPAAIVLSLDYCGRGHDGGWETNDVEPLIEINPKDIRRGSQLSGLRDWDGRGYAPPMSDQKTDRRSPIKDAPLRQAGQSLDEEIARQDEDSSGYLVLAALAIMSATTEWVHFFGDPTPHPRSITICAALVCIYSATKIRTSMKKQRNLRQGKKGEVSVGQDLEFLREKGFKVLHDVLGEGFNVDHVLIGPKGIFTVETKTWSKSAQKPTSIHYDGKVITVGGHAMIADPVGQAKAQAYWLKDLIKKQTGKDFAVWPVVVFPGWWVDPQPHGAEAWVLNPKALPAFLGNQKPTLSDDDVEFVYARLADYVRTSNR